MVDEAAVARLLGVLARATADLHRYRDTITAERLRTDADAVYMVQAALYTAAQAAIDLALHWTADAALGEVKSYADAFELLGRAGLVPEDLAARMASWARLRNVLAHLYAQLDPDRLHAALTEVADLEQFAQAVARA